MKKCKSCQKEIDLKATKCPYCQTDQRNWFGKHKALTVIGGLILFFIIGGSLGSSSNDKSVSTTTPTTAKVVNITSEPVEKKEEKTAPTKSPQATLEQTLSNSIKQIDNEMTYRKIEIENSASDRPSGTKMITVSIDVKSFFNKSSLLKTTGKVSTKVFQIVFGDLSLNAYDVFVYYYGETTDKYGNKANDPVLIYDIDKITYGKINWQNFDQSTLCDFLKQEAITSGKLDTACNVLVNIK